MPDDKKRIIWVYPDRGGRQLLEIEERLHSGYRDIGRSLGVEVLFVAPETIDVRLSADGSSVVSFGATELSRRDTVFVTDAYVFPHEAMDAWLCVSTFSAIELAGYYLPIPTAAAVWSNDKLATMLRVGNMGLDRLGIRMLPTVRLTAGRSVEPRSWTTLLAGLECPLVVKPSCWGSGLGVNVVHDLRQLQGLVSLAQGGTTTLVIQPKVGGDETADVRVYLVDGNAVATVVRRPQNGSLVSNSLAGGKYMFERPRLPSVIRAGEMIAAELGLAYVCVDFLDDGDSLWFSEIELDGAIPPWEEQGAEVVRLRFEAYLRHAAARTDKTDDLRGFQGAPSNLTHSGISMLSG